MIPHIRSLRSRIVVSTAVAVTFLLAAMGLIGNGLVHSETAKVLEERLQTAELLAARVDTALGADVDRIHILTQAGVFSGAVQSQPPDTAQIERVFGHLELLTGGVLLFDNSGHVLWSRPEPFSSAGPAIASTLAMRVALSSGSPQFSKLIRLADGEDVIALVQPPAPEAPGPVVVVLANLRNSRLQGFLTDAMPPIPTGHAVLADRDSTVLASTDSSMLFTQEEHAGILANIVRLGRAETVVANTGPGRSSHLIAAAPLRRAPWVVSLGQAESETMASVTRLRWQLMIFGLAAVGLAVAYTWWDTTAVTRPLALLTSAAGEIAAGNLNAPVAISRPDEIGTLGTAFDTMRVRLRESRQALESALAEARQREQETDALFRVSREILSTTDLSTTLQTVTDQARALLGADIAILCLRQEEPEGVHVAALSDPGGYLERLRARGSQQNPAEPCDLCPLPEALGAPTHRSATLRVGNRSIGSLCVAGGQLAEGTTGSWLLEGLANLAAIATENARLHERSQVLAVFEERDRIARELHDSVAQTLGYIYSRTRLLQERYPRGRDADLWAHLEDLARVSSAAYDEVRWAIFGLRTVQKPSSGLVSAIAGFLRDFTARTGIQAELTGDALGRLEIGGPAEAQLVRIIQEALTNVGKHAQASQVWVRAEEVGGGIQVTIEDNGRGFDPKDVVLETGHGFGLATMHERAEAVGGNLEIHSAAGAGTRVRVWLPRVETRR